MIPFNKPPVTGSEIEFISKAISSDKLCGDGFFGKECQKWFEVNFRCKKTLMVPSCTHALELAALLLDIEPGDEIIIPSYTFVSSANPFVLRGAKIVFVDVKPDTMNIDENKIESAITSKTRAIIPVHYAGVACEMDKIMEIASKYQLVVVEDAAQGVMSKYKGRYLGTIGHLGAYSFHETKNFTSGGEGGLLLINDEKFISRAEIIREKGTNRSNFIRGQVDKYTWVDIGSSYLPSELQSAYLLSQLNNAQKIITNRLQTWSKYFNSLKVLSDQGFIKLPTIPQASEHNAHMFFIKLENKNIRDSLIDYMKSQGITAPFHYIPLHSAPASRNFSRFSGEDEFTTVESEKLVRLPLYYSIENDSVNYVISCIFKFFKINE